MQKIKITHLITELSIGGAQTALLRLLSHLDRSRFAPEVICLYNGDQTVAQQIRALGIPVTDMGMTSKVRLDALGRLYRLLRQKQPIILHCWMFHANLIGRFIGKAARVPLIITARRNVNIGGPRREMLKRWSRHLDNHVIAVCQAARQAEIERTAVLPDKVTTIYNGIDLFQFEPANAVAAQAIRDSLSLSLQERLPAEACLVGTVCRLHPQKGLTYLLSAIVQVRKQVPEAHFMIIGTGELWPELEAQAQQLAITNHVHFLGERRDVPQLLAGLDLFVLPSLWEGMPNVALEAMAARLPIVATAVGGTPEVVLDGVTGVLVPPQDAEALAEAIGSLLNDEERARAMGEAAYQRVVSEFSIRGNVEQTERLYDTLLREKLNLHYEAEKGWLSVG